MNTIMADAYCEEVERNLKRSLKVIDVVGDLRAKIIGNIDNLVNAEVLEMLSKIPEILSGIHDE